MEICWWKERTGIERAGRESKGNNREQSSLEKVEIQQKAAGIMDGKI